MFLRCLLDPSIHALTLAHIDNGIRDLLARSLSWNKFLGKIGQEFGLDVGEGQAGAAREKDLGRCAADAGCGACWVSVSRLVADVKRTAVTVVLHMSFGP